MESITLKIPTGYQSASDWSLANAVRTVTRRRGWLLESILGLLRLAKDRPCALKGVRRGSIFAFDATVRGHLNIVDSRQRGFRSAAGLNQF